MKYLFAGGGTAGHINPALAVANYIKSEQPDAEIYYIGTAQKLEARLVPAAGYEFFTINVSGFKRSLSPSACVNNLKTVYRAIKSSHDVKRILKKIKPDVVIGTGGYVSGPVLRTAAKMGFKTAIHEQNAYPGITNKMLFGLVDLVMLAMPKAMDYIKDAKNVVVTGNPIRADFNGLDKAKSRAKLSIPKDAKMVLSFGGSLGARPVNEAVAQLLCDCIDNKEMFFCHATGKAGYDSFCELLKAKNVDKNSENLRVFEYINDIYDYMAAADLIVSRAGAITLCELQALGRASILIPSPYVAENHQYHNAMTLKNQNAAEVIEEKDLTDNALTKAVDRLFESKELTDSMGKAAAKSAISGATEKIYSCIMELLNKN